MTKKTATLTIEALLILRAIVDEQANDEALWFLDPTAPEAHLQRALRRLHTAAEAVTDCVSQITDREVSK